MSEEVKFTYYLDGKKVERHSINWESNITVKVVLEKVYITPLAEGHLSTRHKAKKEDLIKK
jgi:hypothetical protein